MFQSSVAGTSLFQSGDVQVSHQVSHTPYVAFRSYRPIYHINTPSQYTLSIHTISTPSQPTLITHPINTPAQPTSQHTLSVRTLSLHQAAVKLRFLQLLRRLDGACQKVPPPPPPSPSPSFLLLPPVCLYVCLSVCLFLYFSVSLFLCLSE